MLLALLVLAMAALALASCGGDDQTILVPGGGGGGGGGGTGTVSMGSGVPARVHGRYHRRGRASSRRRRQHQPLGFLVSQQRLLHAVGRSTLLVGLHRPGARDRDDHRSPHLDRHCSRRHYVGYRLLRRRRGHGCRDGNGTCTLTATGTVTVAAAAAVGSIQFISATPDKIGLQGTGGIGLPETSTVVFRLSIPPAARWRVEDVTFAAEYQVGGITITPATGTSGADGTCQTVVQRARCATSVRVTATVDLHGHGHPVEPAHHHHRSCRIRTAFSIARTCPNVEAFDYDGVQDAVTVRSGRPFPEPGSRRHGGDTSTAEGGSIAGGCTTTTRRALAQNRASARSTGPAPVRGLRMAASRSSPPRSARRASPMPMPMAISTTANAFDDLGEAFRDDDEDGAYELPGEFFYDFDSDSMRDRRTASSAACSATVPVPRRVRAMRRRTARSASASTPRSSCRAARRTSARRQLWTASTAGEGTVLITVRTHVSNPCAAGTHDQRHNDERATRRPNPNSRCPARFRMGRRAYQFILAGGHNACDQPDDNHRGNAAGLVDSQFISVDD